MNLSPARDLPVRAALGLGGLAVVILPGFNAGAFYPGTTGLMATLGAAALAARLALGRHPWAAFGRLAVVAGGALTLLAVISLLSSGWSHASSRALFDYDRVLLYLLLFVLGATVPYTNRRLRAGLVGVAVGIVVVVSAGVLSRLLPDVVATTPTPYEDRLSFPVGYWNGLGVLAAIGLLLSLGLSADRGLPRAVRGLATATLPVLALGLYLTLSRGAIALLALGIVALVLAGRPRSLMLTLLAGLAPIVAVLAGGVSAELLTKPQPRTVAAVAQGHHLLLILGLTVLVAGVPHVLILRWDERIHQADRAWRGVRRMGLILAIVAVIASIPLGLPSALGGQVSEFVHSKAFTPTTAGSSRLLAATSNGRIEHWRVALDGWRAHPLVGSGAGTYELRWLRDRRIQLDVVHAHSLYLGMLSDLGLAGTGLVLVAILTAGTGIARRARGDDRLLPGVLFAAWATWALHTGIDWDWELPATSAWLFPLAGLTLARPDTLRSEVGPRFALRLSAVLGALVLAVSPALVALSQAALDASVKAFRAGDCTTAIDRAVAAKGYVSGRPEPYEVLGLCDVRIGRPALGAQMMRRASKRDPADWEFHYGLALALAAAGQDPHAALRTARLENPRGIESAEFLRALSHARGPRDRRQAALRAPLP